jgi:hypothetical protein
MYAAAGPLVAIGIPPGERLLSTNTRTLQAGPCWTTSGLVETNRDRYQYALNWRLVDGRPAVGEVLPAAWVSGDALPPQHLVPPDIWSRLLEPPLQPLIDLDLVAARLWEVVLPVGGLPLAARCVAAWWRCQGKVSDQAPDLLAAAVHYEIARLSGQGQTYAQAAERHQVADSNLRRLVSTLRPRLRADPL